jgi:bacterioferritin B
MPSDRTVDALNEQIAAEFAAAHQYTAVAVHYDSRSFPRLARFFYAQAAEERSHGMMMIKYLVDTGSDVRFGDVPAPQDEFADHVAPIKLALDQERSVTRSIARLAEISREEGDPVSEQFIQWFLREQVEEEATMSEVLDVAERVRDLPMTLEEYIAREHPGGEGEDPMAPRRAGE